MSGSRELCNYIVKCHTTFKIVIAGIVQAKRNCAEKTRQKAK
jgi:hypothetical protein